MRRLQSQATRLCTARQPPGLSSRRHAPTGPWRGQVGWFTAGEGKEVGHGSGKPDLILLFKVCAARNDSLSLTLDTSAVEQEEHCLRIRLCIEDSK